MTDGFDRCLCTTGNIYNLPDYTLDTETKWRSGLVTKNGYARCILHKLCAWLLSYTFVPTPFLPLPTLDDRVSFSHHKPGSVSASSRAEHTCKAPPFLRDASAAPAMIHACRAVRWHLVDSDEEQILPSIITYHTKTAHVVSIHCRIAKGRASPPRQPPNARLRRFYWKGLRLSFYQSSLWFEEPTFCVVVGTATLQVCFYNKHESKPHRPWDMDPLNHQASSQPLSPRSTAFILHTNDLWRRTRISRPEKARCEVVNLPAPHIDT